MLNRLICLALGLIISGWGVSAPLSVTLRSPESLKDHRLDYDEAVIRLALDKTVNDYGPYTVEHAPRMTYAQAEDVLKKGELSNFIMKMSYHSGYQTSLSYVPFPVDLGIVGYRVCFTSEELKPELAEVTTLEQLKQYTHGQGKGWADVEILTHNGFSVREVAHYESLFLLAAHGRIDLFCRGTNELMDEYQQHQQMSGLTYDESFMIVYPLPRFYYVHKENKALADRLGMGLRRAYADGSLQALWKGNFQKSIEFAALEKRRVFTLENPLLKGVDKSYQQYIYRP